MRPPRSSLPQPPRMEASGRSCVTMNFYFCVDTSIAEGVEGGEGEGGEGEGKVGGEEEEEEEWEQVGPKNKSAITRQVSE